MRATFVVLGLLAVLALARSESCSMASDCQNLNCPGSERCEGMVCTCEGTHNMCSSRADCASMHLHGHCTMDRVHCVDGRCMCNHH